MRNADPCPPTFPPVSVCLTTDGTALSRRSCSLALDFSAIPPMHDAAASTIVCRRRGRLTRARAMGDAPPITLTAPPSVRPPPFPFAANPIVDGHLLKGEYSDGDGTTRTDASASALGRPQRHRGTPFTSRPIWASRMGATRHAWGLVRLGRRRRMSGESISMGARRTDLPPPPGRACPHHASLGCAPFRFPPHLLVLIHVRAGMSASNDSR
ncbi:hypothetical protein B0H13DRAFT_2053507 [Mycena leptocephala]|nr:hypothetical protein B0H13DRAFT_2053507 [Mycena leptocephala]